jgi:hypothetical protein
MGDGISRWERKNGYWRDAGALFAVQCEAARLRRFVATASELARWTRNKMQRS